MTGDENPLRRAGTTRRTALRTLAGIALAGTGAGTSAAARASAASRSSGEAAPDFAVASGRAAGPEDAVGPRDRGPDRASGVVASSSTTRSGAYLAVVDRIVDGEHVVLLLEDDGRVVDQLVEPRDRLPDVSEGDALVVVVIDGAVESYRPLETDVLDRLRDWLERLSNPLGG